MSIHAIKFSEPLEDNVIILYSINVKIAKIGFTRFFQTTVFAVFFVCFLLLFFTQEYRSIKIYETKRCEIQTHIQSVELMKQTFLASCWCALETRYCLADIHPQHILTLKYTMSYYIQ